MNSALRKTRTAVALTAATALLSGLSLTVVADTAAAETKKLTATTAVNVRSKPTTKAPILGGLYSGQLIMSSGTTGGWTKINYNGRTAYVATKHVTTKGASRSIPAKDVAVKGKSGVWTKAGVNVRSGPSHSYRVVATMARGTKILATGTARYGYTQVSYGGRSQWVNTAYLTTKDPGAKKSAPKSSKPKSSKPKASKPKTSKPKSSAPKASTPKKVPKVTGTRYATTALMVRTNSSNNFTNLGDVPRGTKLSITGKVQNGRMQIVHKGAARWVTAQYLSSSKGSSASSSTPKVTGTRYATTALMVRTTSGSNFKNLGDVARGTKLSITGKIQNGRMQIVHKGKARWVTAQYLSSSKPGSSSGNSKGVSSGLTPTSKRLLSSLQANFPAVKTYYGVRPDSVPDHPSGKALDAMLPNYQSASGKALGQRIANWAKANHKSLNIEYIIWNQHIWNVKRSSEGWRYMASRGSDTANHKDHVHITVLN
ncbi:MAG: SH3 domain-containing protein [Propionibacteriaceae bacterium]